MTPELGDPEPDDLMTTVRVPVQSLPMVRVRTLPLPVALRSLALAANASVRSR